MTRLLLGDHLRTIAPHRRNVKVGSVASVVNMSRLSEVARVFLGLALVSLVNRVSRLYSHLQVGMVHRRVLIGHALHCRSKRVVNGHLLDSQLLKVHGIGMAGSALLLLYHLTKRLLRNRGLLAVLVVLLQRSPTSHSTQRTLLIMGPGLRARPLYLAANIASGLGPALQRV